MAPNYRHVPCSAPTLVEVRRARGLFSLAMRPGSPSAKLRVAGPLVALALIAALALAAPSLAAASTAPSRVHPKRAVQARRSRTRVLDYWTPARMRATPPLDGPEPLERPGRGELRSGPRHRAWPRTRSTAGIFVRQGNEQGFCSGDGDQHARPGS